MINYRYLSFVFYIVSFSVCLPSIGLAKDPPPSSVSLNSSTTSVTETIVIPQERSSAKLVAQSEQTESEELNHSWLIAGIVVTSLLFLWVLRLLLKPERSPVTENSVDNKLVSSLDDTSSSSLVNYHEQNYLVKKPPEEETWRMIGIEHSFNFAPEPLAYQELELASCQSLTTLDSVRTITPSLLEQSWQDKSLLDATALGKLTIISSETTEIDLVLELIQDLQQSRTLENIAASKELRRKAIWELGQTHDFRAVEPLIQILPEVDSLDKSLILDAIAQIANHSMQTINEALLISLQENDSEIRNSAIRDLNTLYQSISAITINLSRMSEHPNREIQQIARWALEQFNQVYLPELSAHINFKRNFER